MRKRIIVIILLLFFVISLLQVSIVSSQSKDIYEWLNESDENPSKPGSQVNGLDPAEVYFNSYGEAPDNLSESLDDGDDIERRELYRKQDFAYLDYPEEIFDFNSQMASNYRIGSGVHPDHVKDEDVISDSESVDEGIHGNEIHFKFSNAYPVEIDLKNSITVHYSREYDDTSVTANAFPDGEMGTQSFSDIEDYDYINMMPKEGELTYLHDGKTVKSKTGPIDTDETECSCEGEDCSYDVTTDQKKAVLDTSVPDVDNFEVSLVNLDGDNVYTLYENDKTNIGKIDTIDYSIDNDSVGSEDVLNNIVKLRISGSYNTSWTIETRDLSGACSDDPEWDEWQERGDGQMIENFEYNSDIPRFVPNPKMNIAIADLNGTSKNELLFKSSPTPLAFRELYLKDPTWENNYRQVFKNRFGYFTARDRRWDSVSLDKFEEASRDTSGVVTPPRENYNNDVDPVDLSWNVVSPKQLHIYSVDPVSVEVTVEAPEAPENASDVDRERFYGAIYSFQNGEKRYAGGADSVTYLTYHLAYGESKTETLPFYFGQVGVNTLSINGEDPVEIVVYNNSVPSPDFPAPVREPYVAESEDKDKPVHLLRAHAFPSTEGVSTTSSNYLFVDNDQSFGLIRPVVRDSYYCDDDTGGGLFSWDRKPCNWSLNTTHTDKNEWEREDDGGDIIPTLYTVRNYVTLRTPAEKTNYKIRDHTNIVHDVNIINEFTVYEADISTKTINDSKINIAVKDVATGENISVNEVNAVVRAYNTTSNEYLTLTDEIDSDGYTLDLESSSIFGENETSILLEYEHNEIWHQNQRLVNEEVNSLESVYGHKMYHANNVTVNLGNTDLNNNFIWVIIKGLIIPILIFAYLIKYVLTKIMSGRFSLKDMFGELK